MRCTVYTGTILPLTSVTHGNGTLRWNVGAVYIGDWQHGKHHGQGVYLNAEDDIYQGGWKDDMYHCGSCVSSSDIESKFTNTTTTTTTTTNLLNSADSIMLWADGRWYQGGFYQGKRHGYGRQSWPFGAQYQGAFEHDKRQGYGVYVYADGRKYTGMYTDEACCWDPTV